jgi:hypothetical protein
VSNFVYRFNYCLSGDKGKHSNGDDENAYYSQHYHTGSAYKQI